MAKQFKVILSTGKDQQAQTYNVEQGAGQRGKALILKAQAGAKYQLVESAKRDDLAPDNIKAKRVGKHLHLMFEADELADVVIEDYYSVIGDSYNGIVGKAENGRFYEYLTEDPTDPGLIPLLRDNVTAVTQALGGTEVSGAGAVIAVAGAAFSPLWAALGLGGVGAAVLAATPKSTTPSVAPVTPTGLLDAVSDSGVKTDNKTKDNTPTISGKATPGALVEVLLKGQTYTTTADTNGNYAVTIPDADKLPDGVYTPLIKTTSGTGASAVVSTVSATPFTIDTVTSVNIENAGTAGTTKPLSGVSEPGDVVVLKDKDGNVIGSAIAGADGRWSVTPVNPVPAGNITATATDPSGNTATDNGPNTVAAPASPAITSVVDDVSSAVGLVQKYAGQAGDLAQGNTNDTKPTINGTGVPASVLTVYDNTSGTPVAMGTTTVGADGKWTFTPTNPLSAGVHKFSAGTATAPSTGEYPVNIDTTGPSKPVNDPTGNGGNTGTGTGNTFSVIDNVGTTQGNVPANATIDDTTPVVNGKGAPGDVVKIYDNGVLLGSTTVGTDGKWTFKPTTLLADGTHPITVDFTDPSGNTSGLSNPLPFVIDSSKTPISIVDVNDNVAPAAGLVQPNGLTNDTTPTIEGKGTPGKVLTIKDGDTVLGTTTVAADGTWAFTPTTPLADGPHSFTATGPDSAGVSSTTGAYPLVIDTAAPTAPTIVTATDDVGGHKADNPHNTVTDDATPTLNGKAEPHSTVTITDPTGNVVGTAKTDPNGNWSLTLPALPADGTYTYKASSTDAAGNVSPESAPFNVILDTKADTTPPTVAITRSGTGTLSSSETITFTLSEASTTFTAGDVDVTGGTLSNFMAVPTSGTAGTGFTVYTATFTPTASSSGTATMGVASDKFNDNAGNANKDTYVNAVTGTVKEADNQISIVFNTNAADTATPTVMVARAGSGMLASGASETITFTLSEASKDFSTADIDVTGGTLSGFTPVAGSGNASSGYTLYSATFTPNPSSSGTATVGVGSGKFADASANLNKDTYATGVTGTVLEGNNQVSMAFNTTTADTVAPTVAITRSGTGTLTSSETVYFTLSEASVSFDISDVAVSGGTLSSFAPVQSSGSSATGYTQYAAIFTPTASSAGRATLGVASDSFTDAAGNANKDTYVASVSGTVQEADNQLSLNYDTTGKDTAPPTLAITSDKATLQAGEPAAITFTLSEAVSDFTAADITVSGGTLSGFAQSPTEPNVYTATFTPTASGTGSISVPSGKFSDAAGNLNTDGAEVNNNLSLMLTGITGVLADPSDTGVKADNKTTDNTPTIEGKAAPGATVEVTLNGKTYTATASPTGDYSVTVPDADKLPDGVYTPTIKATTPTGTSTVSATPFTIDTVTQVNIENPGTADTTQPISGTSEPGDVVVLKDVNGNPIGSTTAGPDGRWSLTPTSAVPAGPITATATDPSGNTATDNGNNTVAAPVSPAITSVVDDLAGVLGTVQKYAGQAGDIAQGNTNDTQPTINGTGAPGSVLTVFDNTSGTPVALGTTTVDASGQWTFTPTTALAAGVHKFSAGVTNPAGATTPSTGEYAINVDTTGPAKPVNDPTNNDANTGTGTGNTFSVIDGVGPTQGVVVNNPTIDDNTPAIQGKGTAGDLVKIYDNGVLLGSAVVGADGKWAFTPTTPLADGKHAVATEVVDPSGNTSPRADAVPFVIDTSKTPVSIVSANDNVAPVAGLVPENTNTNDNTPTIAGTGTPGTVVAIKNGNTPLGTATVLADGTWSFTPTSPLADGPHNFTATGPDKTGVSSTTAPYSLVIDTSAPTAPTIVTAGDDVGPNQALNPHNTVTDDATPTLNGKAEPSSTVTLKDLSGNVIGTAKADTNGNWSLTLPALPADGTYTYKASSTDAAGNVSVDSAPFNVILDTQSDTTPPTVAIMRSGTGSLSGALASETITFTLSEASTTFALGDIDVIGGSLSNFTPVSTSGTAGTGYTVYTATFTPTPGTNGSATLGVASDKFTDAAGNLNKDTYSSGVTGTVQEANNLATIAYNTAGTDTAVPTVVVARAGTAALATGNTETLTFTLSETSKDFSLADIDVTGGSLSGFAPVPTSGTASTGYNQYTAVFTPLAGTSGTASVGVSSGKFADATGNFNKDTYVTGVTGTTQETNNQVTIAFNTTQADTTPPTVAVTRTGTGTLTSSETVYFTLSEASSTFDIADIDVTGGTLSNFTPVATTGTATSGYTQYSATFTPAAATAGKASIGVVSDKFADAAGNLNKDTYQIGVAGATQEADNQISFNVDTTGNTDTQAPTIAITSDKAELTLGQSATVTFTLSEDSNDFTAADIAVSGGTLSNFSGSGKVYTATFAPSTSGSANGLVSVASAKFSDATSNFNADGSEVNNSVAFVVRAVPTDTTPPTVAISRNGSGTLTSTETITFTLSEASTNFSQSDIDVAGGTLSNFTAVPTSGTAGTGYTQYTATFKPNVGSTGTATIGVLSDKFVDAAGNLNKDTYASATAGTVQEANNQISIGYNTSGSPAPADSTAPSVIVTRAGSGTLATGNTDTISFTLSEASKDFSASDIDVVGGTLSDFVAVGTSGTAATGYTQYTATFTPRISASGTATIGVASGKFADAAANTNKDTYLAGVTGTTQEANNQVSIGYNTTLADTTAPTVAVTRAGTGTLNSSETIYFTLSEASSDFAMGDVAVMGGTLSAFAPVANSGTATSGYTQYSAIFTPTAGSSGSALVGVASGKFADAAANLNQDTYLAAVTGSTQEANNQVVFNFDTTGTRDTTPPTIAITSDKTQLLSGQSATITFTLSENSSDFTAADVLVTGGTLSNFSGSGKVYTATFNPALNSTANSVISVASGKFADAAGNLNADGAEINNSVTMVTNTIDTIVPTVAITSDKASLASGDNATITFTFSEPINDLPASNVIVSGGTLTGLAPVPSSITASGSYTQYTATFVPTTNSTEDSVIYVGSNSVTDLAGNKNQDGTDANNTLLMPTNTVDNVTPTIAISGDKSILTAGQTATITFTLSENSADFTSGDITVSGGTLTGFTRNSTDPKVYTAVFTPTAGSIGNSVIAVTSGKFSDAAGNQNTDGAEANNSLVIATNTLPADTTPPTIAIEGTGSGTLSSSETILFTLSEASTTFAGNDITVTGGTLSGFTPVPTSGTAGTGYTQYSATFNPTAGTSGNATIGVASDKFTDAAGNLNKDTFASGVTGAVQEANNQVTIAFDTAKADTAAPTIAIARAGSATLATGNTETITFTLSEPSTSFALSDVTVTGGSLSGFAPLGTSGNATTGFTQYVATFTPTAASTGTATIGVASGRFSDAAGNFNKDTFQAGVTGTAQEANNQVSIGFDTTKADVATPTVVVTRSGSGTLTSSETIYFTLSEVSTGFDVTDIDVSGGSLSGFAPVTSSGDSTSGYRQYSVTFTPEANTLGAAVVGVVSGKFADAAGNLNKDTYLSGVSGATQEINNQVTFSYDTTGTDVTPPTIAITSDKASLGQGDTATITFTLSEASTDFAAPDVNVSGGTLSNLSGSGKVYTATFTPTANSTTNSVISVPSIKFRDAAGNFNTDGSEANNTLNLATNTFDITPPSVVVSSSKDTLSIGETATITFTLSEASKDFAASDISVSGGTLSGFAPVASSGNDTTGYTQYTAVYTPKANSKADSVIYVASGKFSDAAANLNSDGAEANNTVTMATDTRDLTPPTVAITSDKASLLAGDTATITFTLSEDSADFTAADVAVTGGTLTGFAKSSADSKVYTATFTPTLGVISNSVVSIASNKFSDAAGNYNTDGAEANNTLSLPTNTIPADTTPPTIAIARLGTGTLSSSETITFTLSEASDDFSLADIEVTDGTLSSLSPVPSSGTAGTGYTQYTAIFTPKAAGFGTATIGVTSDKFTDAAGNLNKDTYLAAVTGTTQEVNNQVSIAYDTSGNPSPDTSTPTVIVARTGAGTLNTGNTETISFTLSEPSRDFTLSDIDVTGGTLSNFVPVAASGSVAIGYVQYTATFTPTAASTGTATIGVVSDNFADAAGNLNKDTYAAAVTGTVQESNNQVSIGFDTTKADTAAPTVMVSRSGSGTLTSSETIYFTLSDVSKDFTLADVEVSGGTLSAFAPVSSTGTSTSGYTQYTATFTPSPSSTGTALIGVSSGKFSDAASNLNKDTYITGVTGTVQETNNLVAIGFDTTSPADTTAPTIAITSDAAHLFEGQTATITFTLSEDSTDFSLGDIDVTNGSLSKLTGSGKVYTATFTPTDKVIANSVISVASLKFRDASGNFNTDGDETNNSLVIATNTTDTTPPLIAITSDKASLAEGQTATISFTLNEASTDFTLADISATGGTLSNLTGSGTSYTATFTPTANSTTPGSVHVASAKFTDAAGNFNADGADANNTVALTIDTRDTTAPTIALSSDKTKLLAGQTATITFTLSEASSDFTLADITVRGATLGTLTPVASSGSPATGYSQYTAVLTPLDNSIVDSAVYVASTTFRDAAGNFNADGTESNNTVLMTTDTRDVTPPTIAITSDKPTLAAGDVATLTFTLSEASSNFTASDVAVTGGTLGTLTQSPTDPKVYTANFTPFVNSIVSSSVFVDSAKFTDAAGNANTDGTDANNTVTMTTNTVVPDTTEPTIAITRNGSGTLSSSETITFSLSEASTTFALGDVDVNGGTLSNFAAVPTSGTAGTGFTQYTATFTPSANSSGNATIGVASAKFGDTAGNLNKDTYLAAVSGTVQEANNQVAMAFNTSLSPVPAADTTPPTVIVARAGSGTLGTGASESITFTLSEASKDFTLNDIDVSGGTLGVLSPVGGSGDATKGFTQYVAVFTPTPGSTGVANIGVASSKFADAAGNLNKDTYIGAIAGTVVESNNQVSIDFNTTAPDTAAPTVAVSRSGTGTLTSAETIFFTLSEASKDFALSDISVSGGTLSSFLPVTSSGTSANGFTQYTATFTPTAASTGTAQIGVLSGTFSDAAGNVNKDTYTSGVMGTVLEANNQVALAFDTSHNKTDLINPTIALSSDKLYLREGDVATITFTLSEESTDFTLSDVKSSGGTLSNFSGSGKVYTATFTPDALSKANSIITVESVRFRDAAGNFNTDGADVNNTLNLATNTFDTVPPTIAISSNKTQVLSGQTATITFTLSEASNDFAQSDVNVSGGTLSNFVQSSTDPKVYTATFTPNANSSTNSVISVASNKFSDLAENFNVDGADANNTLTIITDTVPPTVAITSDKSTLGDGDVAIITFTLSEASSDFTLADIGVTGGTISTLTQSATDPKVYTASFTPNPNSTTTSVVSVASSKFSDAAGNLNADGADVNNRVSMVTDTRDLTPPTIVVTADKSQLIAGQVGVITFTLNEDSTDFTAADVTVSGGTLSNFTGSGKVYTATFTPTAGSTTDGVISVASAKFSDAANNFNTDGADVNNKVTLTTDTTVPTVVVATSKTALKVGEMATVTFTLSKASTDFALNDVAVTGGTLSNFQGSGQVYTATFTPTPDSAGNSVVSVASGKFSDSLGNINADGADANNSVTMSTDTLRPTIALSATKAQLGPNETATVTFTLSEASTDFTESDISVNGGTLSNFSGSGKVYTATFTPSLGSLSSGTVSVASEKFSDANTNFNFDGDDKDNKVTFEYDNVVPTIAVTSDKTALKAGESATITFTLSEDSSDFTADDVTVTGGTLSNFTGSGKVYTATITFTLSESASDFTSADVVVSGGTLSNFTGSGKDYTATFTPTAGSSADSVVSVASSKFADAAGNQNADGSEANNKVIMTTDTAAPTMAISSDKTTLKAGETATITFTVSESVTDFAEADVVVTGGTLSNFTGSGTTYTATFTPTAASTTDAVVSVASNKLSDALGNQNADGSDANNKVTMTADTVRPTIAITRAGSGTVGAAGDTITFTLSEASTDFTADDVDLSSGTLSNFSGSGTTFTATFVPSANTATNVTLGVASDKFSDAAGNLNKDTYAPNVSGTTEESNNLLSFASDSVSPTIAITRNGTGTLGVNGSSTETITFTLSEASSDFTLADIDVTGGAMSNFAQSGTNPLVYTATFTPQAGATGTGTFGVDAAKFKDAGGNLNKDTYKTGVSGTVSETNNTVSVPYENPAPTTTVSFTSMTKDTGINENTADWTTADTSAGRLISGAISAPLVSGETVKVFSNGTLIGTAVVSGTQWEITDNAGYGTSASWTYTAKVVNASADGTLATQLVNTDLSAAAPVITSVIDANNNTVSAGGTTTTTVKAVHGTSTAGDVVMVYDNATLLASVVAAADGTWSVYVPYPVTGANTFAAYALDANGNQSALSTSYAATSAAMNLVTNSDFSAGNTGFTSAATKVSSGATSTLTGQNLIFNIAGEVYDVDATYTANAGTNATTTTTKANTTLTGATSGDTLLWGTKYVAGSSFTNPDGAMAGDVLYGNVASASNVNIWSQNLTLEAGRSYTITFDYNQFNATPSLTIGDITVPFTTLNTNSNSEAGRFTATFTAAGATGTTRTVPMSLSAKGTAAYGDFIFDNIRVVSGAATAIDGNLPTSSTLAGSASGDVLNYSRGVLSSMAGDDVITATSTSLPAVLAAGGLIDGGSGVDRLKLLSGTKLSLPDLTETQTVVALQEIEVFEMQGNSNIEINANNVLSLGGTELVGYSNGIDLGKATVNGTSWSFADTIASGGENYSAKLFNADGSVATASNSFAVNQAAGSAPKLTMTDDATLAAANGVSVNYTFAFDQAVTGFDASDVVVTGGGVKGPLVQLDSKTFVMSVNTPDSGTGSMSMAVADGSFSATTGGASGTGASSTQAYDSTVAGVTFNQFASTATATAVNGTANSDNIIAKNITGTQNINLLGGDDKLTVFAQDITGLEANVDRFNAGTGVDTVAMGAGGLFIDMPNYFVGLGLTNFEVFDIRGPSGSGSNYLKLGLGDVLALNATDNPATTVNEAKMMVVHGNANDYVNIVGGANMVTSATKLQAVDLLSTYGSGYGFVPGQTYSQLSYGGGTLFIDESMTRTNV
jgi:hypothetical protein